MRGFQFRMWKVEENKKFPWSGYFSENPCQASFAAPKLYPVTTIWDFSFVYKALQLFSIIPDHIAQRKNWHINKKIVEMFQKLLLKA